MKKLYLAKTIPLGNGRRKAGCCIATTTAKSLGKITADNLHAPKPEQQEDGQEPVTKEELQTLLRNRELMLWTDPKTSEEKPVEVSELAGQRSIAWHETPIGEVPGINQDTAAMLAKAGLETAGDVNNYGVDNNGFDRVPFMTPEHEAALLQVLAEFVPANQK